MIKTFLALFVLAASAYAQPLGFGIKLGVPATDAFTVVSTQSIASSQHFTWGPYVELRLPANNSIELDALRRSYDYGSAGDGSSWEFPLVLKHRIGQHLIKPYLEGGASFSKLSDINLSTLKNRSNYGIVAGAGLEFNLLFLKVSPEVRYTWWARDNFQGSIQTNQNQFAVLMGFGF